MNALQRVPIFHPFIQHPLHLAHQQEYRKELQNWDWERRMGHNNEEA